MTNCIALSMSSSSKSLSSSSAYSSAHFGGVGRRPRARFIRDKTNYFPIEDRKTLTETQTRFAFKRGTEEEEEEEEDCCCSTSGRSFSGSKIFSAFVMSAFLALNESNVANASTILSSSAYSLGEAETTKEQLFSTNAEERRRRMFEIATSSSSSEEQELNENAAANNNNNNNNNNANEENKPELGQGFFKDLEIFIEREPPIAVGFLFLFLINGVWGVIFTLFIRETNAGPGGEFGKGLAALRKEIVKGIFKFFGGALGRFTK
jgi:hypothetical protein|tara:strand:+ start:7804 stop:8595 length:792 start_codon:yes stop_codon:yes gene_type:complete